MPIINYRLANRTQSRSEVGPFEDIEFLARTDTDREMVLYARMESDELSAMPSTDSALDAEFQKFLDDNFHLLHYYMEYHSL